jgi:hypothetical protein
MEYPFKPNLGYGLGRVLAQTLNSHGGLCRGLLIGLAWSITVDVSWVLLTLISRGGSVCVRDTIIVAANSNTICFPGLILHVNDIFRPL